MPEESKPQAGRLIRRQWLIAAAIGAAIVLVIVLGSLELVFYTESTAFCTSCHVMNPEKITHQASPHANVDCGTCHIGPGVAALVESKVASLRYLWKYPTGFYPRPIPSPIKSLRPAEISCGQCHWPSKFYTDRLQQIRHFAEDETNTPTNIAFALKTGGGSSRQGLGRGIHWHIEAKVTYIATDEQRQEIPWVRVEWADGTSTEYVDLEAKLTPAQIAQAPKRLMDCVDCHNRATHIFQAPQDALEQALSQGLIDRALPFIRREGMAALQAAYQLTDIAQGKQQIAEQISAFYEKNAPDVDGQKVVQAIAQVQAIYERTHFPEMKVDWQTHADNIGHKDFPGCFRCHDGKHLSQEGEAIRLECNICHTLPQVTTGDRLITTIDVSPGLPEPESHKSTTWLAEHRFNFGEACAGCHDISNPGGTDNTSFCSNSACHATEWKFAGLNAPGLLEQLRRKLPAAAGEEAAQPAGVGGAPVIPHALEGREDCLVCHAIGSGMKPAPADHEGRTKETCRACHQVASGAAPAAETPTATATVTPTVAAPTPTATASPSATQVVSTPTTAAATPTATASLTAAAPAGAPAIPHALEGRDDCLICHAPDSAVKPAPADHEGRTNESCQACHTLASAASAAPTPTRLAPTATPTAARTTPSSAPAIPHALEGRDDCLICHAPDSAVKPAPVDHKGRTNESCQGCHSLE
jgi:hypothetical protein